MSSIATIILAHYAAGPKPSDLFGKYTWKIEKFSQINKRELRSNAFEVGGYKWYGLLSIFLLPLQCVKILSQLYKLTC